MSDEANNNNNNNGSTSGRNPSGRKSQRNSGGGSNSGSGHHQQQYQHQQNHQQGRGGAQARGGGSSAASAGFGASGGAGIAAAFGGYCEPARNGGRGKGYQQQQQSGRSMMVAGQGAGGSKGSGAGLSAVPPPGGGMGRGVGPPLGREEGGGSHGGGRRRQQELASCGGCAGRGGSFPGGTYGAVGGSPFGMHFNSNSGIPCGGCSTPPHPSGPAESPEATTVMMTHRIYDGIYGTVAAEENNLTDATLRTSDGYAFPVHRDILCAESDYFKALFTSSLNPAPLTDVVIYNIRGEMLSLLLDFVYTREMWLSEANVLHIFEAADYLSLLKIRNKCCEFIESQIEEPNCLGIRRFAQDWFCPELERNSNQYIMRNFVDISKVSEELLDLDLVEVTSLFSDDELNVKNEEVVWEAANRWIRSDEELRRSFIVELLRTVRTGLMDTQYFMEKVKESPYVQGHEGCRPIVIETLRFLYDLEVITERDGEIPTPTIARPRIPHEILFAIGGWSGGSPTSFIETYDTRADRWIRVSEVDPLGPRAYHGTIAVGFKIYVIGGFDGVDYFSSCRVFDAVTKHWKFIAPMYNRRCYVSVAQLDSDKIYAMGGYDGQHRQNSCERYDPILNQWSQICPMNCQRSDASATTLRNVIYICGGFNGVECLNSCECYDPEINQWTMILPMRSRRSGVSCISYNEQVYVVGGFNGVSRMCSGEKYSPETNSWTTIPDMYNPRSNFAIEVIDDLLFCIGGFTGTSTTFNVECYDQRTNEWYEATDMNIYRSALAACVIPGLPNTKDYIHPHRDRLMEEKRQRLLVLQQQQQQQNGFLTDNGLPPPGPPPPPPN